MMSAEKRYLCLLVKFNSREFLPAPFNNIKKDHPAEVVQYIIAYNAGRMHKTWAKNILRSQRRNLRRLNFLCSINKAFHLSMQRVKRKKSDSRNARNAKIKQKNLVSTY